jgi:PhnB protein
LDTLAEFGRSDGAPDAIVRGYLVDGPVTLFGSDATGDRRHSAVRVCFSRYSAPPTSDAAQLVCAAGGGRPHRRRPSTTPWGAHDGKVIDQFGLQWVIGYETTQADIAVITPRCFHRRLASAHAMCRLAVPLRVSPCWPVIGGVGALSCVAINAGR